MMKTFILRTQSLLSSTDSTLRFGNDNEIVIPFCEIDELEKNSRTFSEKGRIAKKILEYLNSFKITELLSEKGVKQKNGSTLRIERNFSDVELPGIDLPSLTFDERRCLQIALGLKNKVSKRPVILVTKNPALRLKAKSIGIQAQYFKDDVFPSLEEQYKGRIDCITSSEKMDLFFEQDSIEPKSIYNYAQFPWMPNMFLSIKSADGKSSALARYDGEKIVKLNYISHTPLGVITANAGQTMLKEALLTPADIAPLVIVKAPAGTGKTYISLAVALEETMRANKYQQILVTAPVEEIGEHIGYLPGDVDSKISPHIGGILDNAKQLLNKGSDKKLRKPESLISHGTMAIQAIGMLRGRTITDTFFIIDETQNIEPDDIKSIVTRAAKGSKFVFLGDPTQIDNPALNEKYNGLVYLSEKMKDSPLAWQIALNDNESVRSDLARYAASIL